jgi:hypothetical protein
MMSSRARSSPFLAYTRHCARHLDPNDEKSSSSTMKVANWIMTWKKPSE